MEILPGRVYVITRLTEIPFFRVYKQFNEECRRAEEEEELVGRGRLIRLPWTVHRRLRTELSEQHTITRTCDPIRLGQRKPDGHLPNN